MKTSFRIIAGLVFVMGIVFLTASLNGSENVTIENKKAAEPNVNNKAVIKGRVVDSKGKGIAGVDVHCVYLS